MFIFVYVLNFVQINIGELVTLYFVSFNHQHLAYKNNISLHSVSIYVFCSHPHVRAGKILTCRIHELCFLINSRLQIFTLLRWRWGLIAAEHYDHFNIKTKILSRILLFQQSVDVVIVTISIKIDFISSFSRVRVLWMQKSAIKCGIRRIMQFLY